MHRLCVVGAPCVGKTTLARRIGAALALPHIEQDELFRGPGYEPVAENLFHQRMESAVARSSWVIDGDRAAVRDMSWRHADLVVWLDYRLVLALWRYVKRTQQRRRGPVRRWPETGAPEGSRGAMRRGSLGWSILTKHGDRRRQLTAQISAHPGVAVVRLRSPREAKRWLATIGDL